MTETQLREWYWQAIPPTLEYLDTLPRNLEAKRKQLTTEALSLVLDEYIAFLNSKGWLLLRRQER